MSVLERIWDEGRRQRLQKVKGADVEEGMDVLQGIIVFLISLVAVVVDAASWSQDSTGQ